MNTPNQWGMARLSLLMIKRIVLWRSVIGCRWWKSRPGRWRRRRWETRGGGNSQTCAARFRSDQTPPHASPGQHSQPHQLSSLTQAIINWPGQLANWTNESAVSPVPNAVMLVLWRCWLGSRKNIRPVKNWVVGCRRGYLSGARCRLACGPADATATHCLLLQ